MERGESEVRAERVGAGLGFRYASGIGASWGAVATVRLAVLRGCYRGVKLGRLN